MKLSKKFFLIFFTTTLIPLLIITSIFYFRYQRYSNKQMNDYCSNVIENASDEANQVLDEVSKAASYFSFYSTDNRTSPSIVNTLKKFSKKDSHYTSYDIYNATKNIEYISQNVLYSNSFIYGIYIFTPAGPVIGHSTHENGEVLLNYSPSNDKWFKFVDTSPDNTMYVSDASVHSMFTGHKQSIFFAKKLKSVYDHKTLGVLVIDCKTSLFDFSNVTTYSDITAFQIINYYTNSNIYCSSSLKQDALLHSNTESKKKALSLPCLVFSCTVDYSELATKMHLTDTLIITTLIISILGILITAILISRYLTTPISILSNTMTAQSHPVMTHSSPYLKRNDEIGILYNEYNNMVQKLDDYIQNEYQAKLLLLNSQLKSLESQINVHFLFNTLETINSKAELDGSEAIASMALSLGNMLRYSIYTNSELVLLREELSQVHDYIKIQSIRYRHEFTYEERIPDSLLNTYTLKLILQPVVENAVLHGIIPNMDQRHGLISLTIYEEDHCLYMKVTDNGQGMDEIRLEELRNQLQTSIQLENIGQKGRKHIGLKNIQSRIVIYYGIGYGISIESTETIGTTITLKLPLMERSV
ncbi:two-component sensor histidine kinase [Lachnospiraceae bacterium KM106-2]|nr:two-component sensor histidine kinase [Lachnospiraceae bacterium KM106-2]